MNSNRPIKEDHEWTEDVRLTTNGTLQPIHPPTESGRHHPRPVSGRAGRWLAVVGSLLVMGVVVSLVMLTGERKPPAPGDSQVRIPPSEPAVQAREARAAALGFIASKDWREALLWVRDETSVEPMMRDYYDRRRESLPGLGARVDEGKPVEVDGRVVCWFNLRYPDGRTTPLSLEWTSVGFRVDWLAFSAYGTMAWDKLIAEKPVFPSDLRVYLCSASADGGATPAQAPPLWVRFRLEHRDSPEALEAWVRDDPLLDKVRGLLRGRDRVPVFLQVRFEEWNGRRLALISAIHHENWSL